MNKEQAIKILDKFTTEHKFLNIKHSDGLEEAIETLLTAYEKEKEKNKNAREIIEYYLVGNFTLNDFDKRNKELRKIEKILEE